MGRLAQGAKLNGQSVGKAGFSRRRRARNHYKFYIAPAYNLLGYLSNLSLLFRLLNQYQIAHGTAAYLIVQIPHRLNSGNSAPLAGAFHGAEELSAVREFSCFHRILPGRQKKHKPFLIWNYIKPLHISRIGKHISVIIIIIPFHLVYIHAGTPAVAEQLCLIFHSLRPKQFHGVFHMIRALLKHCLLFNQLLHSLLQFLGLFFVRRHMPLGTDINSPSHRKFHITPLGRLCAEYIIHTLQEKHGGPTHIRLVSHIIFDGKKVHRTILDYFFKQFLYFPIDCRSGNHAIIFLPIFLSQILQYSTLRNFYFFPMYCYRNHVILPSKIY